MKPHLTPLLLAGTMSALLMTAVQAAAWPMWDAFKAANIEEKSSRVIDYSDSRSITTSEGQSYAMFFALVADDRDTFAKLLDWTEKNLSKGDIEKNLPSWLWGKSGNSWGVIDSNNATDSDLWIAYDLLEAARLWNMPEYEKKALAMMERLKGDVRDVPNLGKVLLPGGSGFDHPTHVTLNPSYYPVFILRRFSEVDPYWKDVTEGTIHALVRTAPAGFSPDWAKIDKAGRFMTPEGDDYTIGSYNAIRVYLWTAMLAPEDPAYGLLMHHFDPMRKLTERMNMPPEKVEILTGAAERPGNPGFGACLLEMLGESKTAALIRTVIAGEPIVGENYYRNVLMLYGAGFDQGFFRFDPQGRLVLPKKTAQPAAAAPAEAAEAAETVAAPAADAKAPAKTDGKAAEKPQPQAQQKAQAAQPEKSADKAADKAAGQPAAAASNQPAAEGATK